MAAKAAIGLKGLNCIGALKHHLLPQADGQHAYRNKRIASNGGRRNKPLNTPFNF